LEGLTVTRHHELLLVLASFALAGSLPARGQPPIPSEKQKPADGRQMARVDLYGDALPDGAVARMGTVRLRHGRPVVLVTFLADGKLILSVGMDGTACQWDAATGKEQSRFSLCRKPNGELSCLALSADGKILASSDKDKNIRLWDAATGKELQQISTPKDDVRDLALSREGKELAVQAESGMITLFDVAAAKEIRRLGERSGRPHDWAGEGVAFSPNDKTVIGPRWEGNEHPVVAVRFWDKKTGAERHSVLDPEGVRYFDTPTFSPDGSFLAWSKEDGMIRITDAATGKLLRKLNGPGRRDHIGASSFAFARDGKTLAAHCHEDESIRVWDVATGTELHCFPRPTFYMGSSYPGSTANRTGMAFSPDGRYLAVGGVWYWEGGDGHSVHVLEVATGKEQCIADGHRSAVSKVSYSADGNTLTTWGEDGGIRVWEGATGKELRQMKLPAGAWRFILSDDGRTLLTQHTRNTLRLSDAATGKELGTLMRAEMLGPFAFSPDSKTLAVEGQRHFDVAIWLYDAATGKERLRIPVPGSNDFSFGTKPVPGIVFSPDGKVFIATITPQALGLWETATGEQLWMIKVSERRDIHGAVFAPDGRSLALDLGEDLLSIREVATGKERCRYGQEPAPSRSGSLRSGSIQVFALPLFTRPAASVAFSSDGGLLAQCRFDGTVSLWETTTGKEVGRLAGHASGVGTLAFAPNGETLATGSRDTTALTWDLSALHSARKAQGAALSAEEAQARWNDLAGDDAARAFEAICSLVLAPGRAVPLLRAHLKPVAPADAEKVRRWIANLDSEDFELRERASAELAKLGESAKALLRKALADPPSAEARKRLEALLAPAPRSLPTGEALRQARALEVLERIGTPEARQVLEVLAGGAGEARLTEEARAALDRLTKRTTKP
jgi:WD40 repeat protein